MAQNSRHDPLIKLTFWKLRNLQKQSKSYSNVDKMNNNNKRWLWAEKDF